jgi:hypothetical protein
LVNLKPGDMARLEISFDQGPALALSRAKKDGAWSADRTPSGQKVRADAVSALLGAVGSLRFSDTSDPSDPAALAARRHERTITLSPFSGPALVIALGRQPESKSSKPAVPPGPVYAFVTSSDPGAPINAIMKKRSFQIDDYAFTSLPQNPADLFEPAAPAAKTAP